MDNKELNSNLKKLWKKNEEILKDFYGGKNKVLSPMVFSEDEKISDIDILFVGMNPSFSEQTITKYKVKPSIFYFNNYDLKKDEMIKYEKIPKDDSFFNKINEVSGKYSKKIIDLFFIRKTNQKDFVNNFMKKYEDFANAQLELSLSLMRDSNLKLIVVVNAKATEIIKERYNIQEDDFDDEIGTYRIKINNKKVPVIFSGMLSGQRALDNGSFRRLKWQIDSILSGKTMIKQI